MLDVTEKPAVLGEEEIRRIVRSELELAGKRDPAGNRAAIIASKGTLDWAYPPLILATTAAASGMDTAVFFTFYGLNIIHRDFERLLKVCTTRQPGDADAGDDADLVLTAARDEPGGDLDDEEQVPAARVWPRIAELLESARESGRPPDRLPDDDGRLRLRRDPSFRDGVEFGGAAAFLADARKAARDPVRVGGR